MIRFLGLSMRSFPDNAITKRRCVAREIGKVGKKRPTSTRAVLWGWWRCFASSPGKIGLFRGKGLEWLAVERRDTNLEDSSSHFHIINQLRVSKEHFEK